MNASPYVEIREGGQYVAGSRVSLDSVVIAFQQGASPERIAQCYPTLSLAQVYGAIAYYLENRETVDAYLADREAAAESAAPLSQSRPELYRRLMSARQSR